MIPETIVVKGSASVHLDVRVTRHGPLISDAINANNDELKTGPKPAPIEPLAFRWVALDPDDSTVPSFLRLNDARNWTQFTEALSDYVSPSQNFVYGDVDGHIGYYAPGHIPIRASGDGSMPADGWTGAAEWTGWIPFAGLPHTFDPPEHFIVTANHRPAPASYPYLLGLEWVEPYRAQRITDLLHRIAGSGHRFTPDDFARIQADTVSLHATTLLPTLLAHVKPRAHRIGRRSRCCRNGILMRPATAQAAAIFSACFSISRLPSSATSSTTVTNRYRSASRSSHASSSTRSPHTTWSGPTCPPRKQPVPDDETRVGRRRAEAWCHALHSAAELVERLGDDMTRWRWDARPRGGLPASGARRRLRAAPLLSHRAERR